LENRRLKIFSDSMHLEDGLFLESRDPEAMTSTISIKKSISEFPELPAGFHENLHKELQM